MIFALIADLSTLVAARPQDSDAASVAAAIRYLQELETKHAQHARPRLVLERLKLCTTYCFLRERGYDLSLNNPHQPCCQLFIGRCLKASAIILESGQGWQAVNKLTHINNDDRSGCVCFTGSSVTTKEITFTCDLSTRLPFLLTRCFRST